MKAIILGSVALTLMGVAKAISPSFFFFLPLGGSSIAEMGIVFGFAVSVATLLDLRG